MNYTPSNSCSNTVDNLNQSKEKFYGIPVKFADDVFSNIVTNQIHDLINLPKIKELKHIDENAARKFTNEIIEILKKIVHQHIKDNYKVVIQVITYPREIEENVIIMSQCLWNYRTDDVLSLEIETDIFKFFIIIHGVAV